ncbi:serine/threonine protein kinase [Dokdonella sp.]|uniref:serine/threonine protein kinase n=1 Tax=Dokdonella sp. TaxID=2291710 RepID=UPI003C4082F5
MNPEENNTRVIPGRQSNTNADAITLSLELPARLDDAATVHDTSLSAPAKASKASPRAAQPRYVIVGEAGRGGMATVHVARDVELLRNVALKQLSGKMNEAAAARIRFLREVQVTAQLDHPYIVPIYGLEVAHGGAPAYAMKLVDGRTLFDYLQETFNAYASGGQPDEAHSLAARIEHLIKVCEAVDYAHGKGVIHRDLKPANIMLGAHGETYLMDWGICRLFETDGPELGTEVGLSDSTGGAQTEYGTVVGTPRYMSPEQAQGRTDELGPASDQCALGLMLFEIVTLKGPFEGATALEVMRNAAAGKRASFSHAFERRAVAAPLRAIIERATRYDPQQRYASVRDLADDLRRYLHGEAVHALPDTTWQRAQRFVGRHRQGMLLSLLGLVAVAALGITALMWRHEQQSAAAQAREAMERDFIEHVASEGDALQLRLFMLQSELESLALAATQLIQYGTPALDVRTYWTKDYDDPASRPVDYVLQPELGREVSMQSAVWSAAPGIPQSSLEPVVQRLHHLRGYRNQLIDLTRRSLGGGQYADGLLELKLVVEQGLLMRYPGHALTSVEDLRESGWYVDIKDQTESNWGTPYLDKDGDDVLLPLSTPMRDPDGLFLGALSIDLALDFVAHNLLRTNDNDTLVLLDADANVLASEQLSRFDTLDAQARTLTPFGDEALRAAFKSAEVGAVETRAFGRAEIVAFDHIDPLGWILVLIAADPDAS